jgi:hypothetical protein
MRTAYLCLLLPLVASCLVVCSALAQDDQRTIDPRQFGIDLPTGRVVAGNGETVLTDDDGGQPVVGRLHVRIGDAAVILLPDGQLVSRAAGRFSPTDRKFEPQNKDQLVPRLASEFPNMKTRATNHYIYVYDTSEEFTLATSRILETMLPGVKGYVEGGKIAARNPEFPLVVVMFKNETDFQKYRRMPEGVVAYYHTLSNRVFLYEQSQLANVRPDLAVGQSISTIAHEGVHQILHNIGVQQRLSIWPMWLSEGLAEFFAPTTTGSRLHWKGAGQVNDLRMFEIEQYLKSNAAEQDGQFVEHTVLANQLTSTGYASAWALTHYLAKNRRSEFSELLREASKLGPLEGATDVTPPGIVRSNRVQFTRLFGDDLKDIQRRLMLHLKKQPYNDPFQDAPHIVVTLVANGGGRPQRSANAFPSPQLAARWLRDTLDAFPPPQRNAAQTGVRVFPNRLQAETFVQQWVRGQ